MCLSSSLLKILRTFVLVVVVIDLVGSGVRGVVPPNLLLACENRGGVKVVVNKTRPFAVLLTVVVSVVSVGSAMKVEVRLEEIVFNMGTTSKKLWSGSASTVRVEEAFIYEVRHRLRKGPLEKQF